jgi:hypothetical protein
MQATSKTPPDAATAAQPRPREAEPLGLALGGERHCPWSTWRLRCALTLTPKSPVQAKP